MKLSKNDENRIQKFYQESFVRFGDEDVRSVQWTTRYGQVKRFEVLLNIANVEGAKILDVGCGLGDFYRFLLDEGITTDYTGIDIVPEFIDAARAKFPQTRFEAKDIFDMTETYDYIFASGAMSFKVENNAEHYQNMIKKMYSLAQKGVAFNMLDNASHVDNETYAAYSPLEIADFCSTFANKVEIVTDYLPQDFTIYLYKES